MMQYFIVFFLLLSSKVFSQNLLVNGGFEEENICSEYKVNCAPEGWIYTVPSFIYYFNDPGLAHTGRHFVALIAGHAKKPFYRTFVRSRLLCGLRKGQQYKISFYIKSVHPVLDSMGIYFSNYDFLFEKQPYKTITASVYLKDAVTPPQKDTNWQQVVVNYTATGKEFFVTLGNFKKLDVAGPTNVDRENNFFVLLDDISLVPTNVNEKLCTDWQTTRDAIYAQDERHEYLARLIKMNRHLPPKTTQTTATVLQRIDTMVLPDVFFASASFALNQEAKQTLDSFIRQNNMANVDSVVVEGHTDSTGSVALNKELSQNRAAAVAKYVQPLFACTIVARGMGSAKPQAENNTPAGRQTNRRVEIYLYIKD